DPPSSAAQSEESNRLAKSMPDAPATEPGAADQPSSKKQKLAPADDDDDGWEAIEKPASSADDGNEEELDAEPGISDSEIVDGEKKEHMTAALHTAEMGGNPPTNMLQRDW
ncbi:MAG: hypothetical protein LQ340_008105, partial [Diploschistes diacapsis]